MLGLDSAPARPDTAVMPKPTLRQHNLVTRELGRIFIANLLKVKWQGGGVLYGGTGNSFRRFYHRPSVSNKVRYLRRHFEQLRRRDVQLRRRVIYLSTTRSLNGLLQHSNP